MRRSQAIVLLLCLWLAACAPARGTKPATEPSAPPATPAPTATLLPRTVVPAPGPTADPRLQHPDLSAFVSAWNSRDLGSIRALYLDDATFWSAADAVALRAGETVDARVAADAFAARVEEYGGMRLRVLGEPVGVLGKVVGFAFRWENDREGYNGVSLLRYEGERILLQFYVVDGQLTPNETGDSAYLQPATVDAWAAAWGKGADPVLAAALYTENASVLSDEDLAQVRWRDFKQVPTVAEAVRQYGPWSAVAASQPVRAGNLVWFAWHWSTFTYPLGYGLRVLRYSGERIDLDIRFAIRPWEPGGKTFVSGG